MKVVVVLVLVLVFNRNSRAQDYDSGDEETPVVNEKSYNYDNEDKSENSERVISSTTFNTPTLEILRLTTRPPSTSRIQAFVFRKTNQSKLSSSVPTTTKTTATTTLKTTSTNSIKLSTTSDEIEEKTQESTNESWMFSGKVKEISKNNKNVDESENEEEREREELSTEESEPRQEEFLQNLIQTFFQANSKSHDQLNISVNQKWINIFTSIDNQMMGLVKALAPIAVDLFYEMDLTPECINSMTKFTNGLAEHKEWAYRMMDSNGHFPSGVFSGTLISFGAFDQCLEIQSPSNSDISFRGQYCLMQMRPPLPELKHRISYRDRLISLNGSKFSGSWLDYKIAGKVANGLYSTPFIYNAICVPSTCSKKELTEFAKKGFGSLYDVEVKHCSVQEDKINVKQPELVAIIIVIVSIFIVTFASFLDHYAPDFIHLNAVGRFIGCFSAIKNTKKLFQINETKSDEKLQFVHGARVMTMLWLVVIHAHSVGALFVPMLIYRFEEEARNFGRSLLGQFIFNGYIAVSNFFFISGFVVTIISLPTISKPSTGLSLFRFVFVRWLRFVPALIGTWCFNLIWPLLGSGPVFNEFASNITAPCLNNWWSNLLFVNNWLIDYNMCLVHTWFLAADFQLHILAFFVILALSRRPKIGLTLVITMIVSGIIIPAFIVLITNGPPATMPFMEPNLAQFFQDLKFQYHTTYNHLSSYFTGVLIGYLVSLPKERVQLPKLLMILFWILFPPLSLTGVLGTYAWTGYDWPYNPITSSIFAGCHRFVFSLGIAWIAFACATSNGGFFGRVLALRFFIPLSRLSYSIYLIHILVVWFFVLQTRQLIRWTHHDLIYSTGGVLIYSLFFAFLCYLLFESSWANIIKLVFKTPQPKQKNEEPVDFHPVNGHRLANANVHNGHSQMYIHSQWNYNGPVHMNEHFQKPNSNGYFIESIPNNVYVVENGSVRAIRRKECHCHRTSAF